MLIRAGGRKYAIKNQGGAEGASPESDAKSCHVQTAYRMVSSPYSYIPGYAMYWDIQGRVRASPPKMVAGNKYSLP